MAHLTNNMIVSHLIVLLSSKIEDVTIKLNIFGW